MKRRALALVLACAAVGCIAPVGPPGRPTAELEYRIAPPDVLSITVRPEPEISRQVVVRPDGHISFDLIGDLEVAGKTVSQVQADVARNIQQFIVHPDVTVVLVASNSRRFFVFGEVLRPGAYPLVGDVRAAEALARAGGGTRLAALNSGRLLRPEAETPTAYEVRFGDIILRGDGTTNHALQPGDVIYVPPNASAQIGYALQVIFYPIQQIIGLGTQAVRTANLP